MELKQGLVQVYTGSGKGKTTAALGQAFRAAGNGLKVYMVQFLKSGTTGELTSVKKMSPDFQIFRFEKPAGFFYTLSDEEKAQLKKEIEKAFEFCKDVIKKQECDVLILDEIMGVLGNKLLNVEEVLEFIKSKPEKMELIMTGRNVPDEIAAAADLVTEMREIKHYYSKGIPARKGIEF
ncbi:Cob(I)yrinic acid a,c-diamide adenosyltransferase [Oxobacter pfennigii]|uniref:Cob(I)yrinic acid a,c-diamide adenosyltransferase n=1 Tax=Oxobacter pfennigii TaxID=36849 RepID=A0A0N8NSJ5_9CLOT|nr:cob(I)yrinic acid a,c-diamide adenosyltransferase [Oxobacter pfennigii]KPU42208.1 Cob(I)yrinic acid a,c-diamide adenosyltransferase [Oxobacter pfennigii]